MVRDMHQFVLVPTIITINGVKIMIFADDHNPPHFHARFGERVALVRIADLAVIGRFIAQGKTARGHGLGGDEPGRAGRPLGETHRRRTMTRRIAQVTADCESLTLALVWANRTRTVYDMRPLIDGKAVFAPLRHAEVFAKAQVIEDGLGVGWPGTDADCAADKLWYAARPQDNPFPDTIMTAADFKSWLARHGLSLSGAASLLGISRRQVAAYASGEKTVPRLLFLACMAVSQAGAAGKEDTMRTHAKTA